MDTLSFDDTAAMMAENIDTKINKFNDDQMYLFCGYEGGGKSTVAMALKCAVDKILGRTPEKEHILFDFKEYLTAITQLMVKTNKEDPNTEQIEYWNKHFGFEMEREEKKMMFEHDYKLYKSAIISYDEAGAEAGSRRSMSGPNVEQQNLLIRMRYLGLAQFYCCPKPLSLDNYPREQRPRGMFWCIGEYNVDKSSWPYKVDSRNFDLYFYDKYRYLQIYKQHRYWNLFASNYELVKKVKPSFRVKLPDDLLSYIPDTMHVNYDAKKSAYNTSKTMDVFRKYIIDEEIDNNKYNEEMMVRPGEEKQEWYIRAKELSKTVKPWDYSRNKLWKNPKK